MIDLMYSGIYYSTYLEDRVYNEAITSEGEIDSEHKGINVIRYDILGMKELERFGVDLEGDDERDILRELGIIVFNGEAYKYNTDLICHCLVPGFCEIAFVALIIYRMIKMNNSDNYVFVEGDQHYEFSNSDIEYLVYLDEKYSKKFGFTGKIRIDTCAKYDLAGTRLCSVDNVVMKLCEVKDYVERNYSAYDLITCEHFDEEQLMPRKEETLEVEERLHKNHVVCHTWDEVEQLSKVVYLDSIDRAPEMNDDTVCNRYKVDKTAKYDLKRVESLNQILFDNFITYGCEVTSSGLKLMDTPDIKISDRALELFDMICRDKHVLIFDCSIEDMDDRGIKLGLLECLYSSAFDFKKIYIVNDTTDVFSGLAYKNSIVKILARC